MSEGPHSAFSTLLTRARQGDASAVGRLFTVVYAQMKAVARSQRRRQAEATLNTTALVHEAFLKLAHREQLDVRDRSHFLAVAATAMRQILIDHARSRLAGKRGGGAPSISFDEIESALAAGPGFGDGKAEALLALEESLARLTARSERQARVVECRFFAGLSIEETAAALGTSPATVKRDWTMAQAWLYHDMKASLV